MPQTNDLILAREAPAGNVAIVKDGQQVCLGQRTVHLRPDPQIVDPDFLCYLLLSPMHQALLLSAETGATAKHVNMKDIRKLPLMFLPEKTVQKRIASILTAYDDLIENNRRRIELLEQTARLLYKEWFVHFRFPGHEHVKIVDGVPEGWKTTKLAEVTQINSTTIPSNYDGEVEYVDISSVTTGSINETTRYYFKDAPSRARRVVKHKDIIWSCVRPNRKSFALIMYPPDNLVVSTGFAVISSFDYSSYLYHAITTEEFVKYLSNNARGAAYPAVTASDFEKAEVMLPIKNVLLEFCCMVDPIMEQIHTLQKLSKKLAQARDLLLPRLMNGENAI